MASASADINRTEHQKILRDDLERRCEKNPRYSLRAYARDLKLSPSHLSGVLAGQHGLSRQGALEIAKKLGLSPAETEIFVQSVESRHARSKSMREAATAKLQSLRKKHQAPNQVKLDHFKVIADWFHFAILELTYLKNFSPKISWIAKSLNVHPEVATNAVSRLSRLKMLQVDGESWKLASDQTSTGFEIPSAAIKTFHSQILEKASQALHLQPIEKRDFRSTVLAIRLDRLAEAKIALQKLHQDFCVEISDSEVTAQDDVYCLSTQLFSVTSLQEKNQ